MSGLVDSVGILVKDTAGSIVERSLSAGSGITITYPDGVGGDPIIEAVGGGSSDVNAFGSIIADDTIVADASPDTLTVTGSDGITVTADSGTKTLDIAGPALGDLAALDTVGTTEIDDSAVTLAKIVDATAQYKILARVSASAGVFEELGGSAASFDVIQAADDAAIRSAIGLGALAVLNTVGTAEIDAAAVTLDKMADIATDKLIGRDTALTGVPEAIGVGGGLEFTGSASIQRSALTGDVTATAGSNATTIAADAVTYAKMQDVEALALVGNATNSTATPTGIAAGTDHQVMRRSGSAIAFGAVNLAQAAAVTGALPVANGGTGGTTQSAARTGLGLDSMAVQASGAVSITGGSIAGITDLAVADGGTGASTAAGARSNLGLGVAESIVILDADLAAHTSSTLGNITGLVFPIVDGNLYTFEFEILYRSEFASNGLGLHLTMPAGTIAANIFIPSGTDTGATSFFWVGRRQSSGTAITAPTTPLGNTHMLAFIKGTVMPTASGNLQVQMASEDNSSDIIIKAGTVGRLYDYGVL